MGDKYNQLGNGAGFGSASGGSSQTGSGQSAMPDSAGGGGLPGTAECSDPFDRLFKKSAEAEAAAAGLDNTMGHV